MRSNDAAIVFDYRTLRLLVGIIAFALPFVVTLLSSSPLSSISASYYTEARDAFVGMLFIVASFLWAYNGHSPEEARASKAASVAALLVAIFPTSSKLAEPDIISKGHYVAAAVLFSLLAYFCLVPFRLNTKGKPGKRGRRSKIYLTCGWIMVGSMMGLLAANLILSDEKMESLGITFWAETVILVAFGVAWMVAGKWLPLLVDQDEALQLFSK